MYSTQSHRKTEWYGSSKDELGAVHLETMTLEIEDLHLVVGVRGQTGEGIIQEVKGFSLVLRRLLCDLWHQVPAADLSIKIEELKAALSDKEYQLITECAISNMAEIPNLPPSLF
jgi:vacuolar protein sorting-associated protein 13A/C